MRNMILAIDIGNTNIVVGCIEEKKIYFIERISTNHTKTELEYAIVIKNVLDIFKMSPKELEGGDHTQLKRTACRWGDRTRDH